MRMLTLRSERPAPGRHGPSPAPPPRGPARRRGVRGPSALLVALLLVPWTGSTAGAGADGPVVHLPVEDPVQVAIALSQATFADGSARAALLARADLFADTLAGGGLAGDRPLLLTPGDRLDARVAAELDRLGSSEVLVLGGPSAVGEAVVDELAERGVAVGRAAGRTRVETAVAVAEVVQQAGEVTTALLARADASGSDGTQAFADSIAAGALAAEVGWPVLLSDTDALSVETAEHLADVGYERVVLVGGEAALSAEVAAEVADIVGSVERVAGPTRHHTAVALAEARSAETEVEVGHVVLVDGVAPGAWAAGLAAASYSAATDAPVLLAAQDVVPAATAGFITASPGLAPGADPAALCTADALACEDLERLLAPPGVDCGAPFEHGQYMGCQTTVAGVEVKFFPIAEGRRVQRLVVHLHGDGARGWFENWAFPGEVLGFARAHDMLVLGILAPNRVPDGNGGTVPAYGQAGPEEALLVADGIEAFMHAYAVTDRQSLYWSASGGSWFTTQSLIPTVGHRVPGIFAISCGGSGEFVNPWAWDPEVDTSTRDLFALLFNYGDQDFLAGPAAGSRSLYAGLGFATEEIVHPGAEHCAHPISEPTVAFWTAQLDDGR